jgi:hypothetical protein
MRNVTTFGGNVGSENITQKIEEQADIKMDLRHIGLYLAV